MITCLRTVLRMKRNIIFVFIIGCFCKCSPFYVPNQFLSKFGSHVELFAHTLAEPASGADYLRFGGEISYSSSSLPYSISLHNFFSSHDSQRILLSGGSSLAATDENTQVHAQSHQLTYISFNQGLFDKWKQNSHLVGAKTPDENDSMVVVEPQAIDMVGVRILPQTIIGTTILSRSYLRDCVQIEMPEFQAVLIHDDTRAEGPPFLVWLFNKVSLRDENKKDSDWADITIRKGKNHKNHRALLRVWAEPVSVDSIVFKSSISMWLELSFPSLLLRFFPINKNKAEDKCSSAIVQSLETSFLPAFNNFCKAYNRWVLHNK